MRQLNRSAATLKTYGTAVTQLDAHQRRRKATTNVDEV